MIGRNIARLRRLLRGPAMLAAVFAVIAAPGFAQASADESPVLGLWIIESETVAVEFYPCSDRLCAKIVWLARQIRRDGKIKRDDRNPDPALRDRPQCGIDVVWNLKSKKKGTWTKGRFYYLKKGRTFDIDIKLKGNDRLEMRAYMGVPLLGKTLTWKRPAPDRSLECIPATEG